MSTSQLPFNIIMHRRKSTFPDRGSISIGAPRKLPQRVLDKFSSLFFEKTKILFWPVAGPVWVFWDENERNRRKKTLKSLKIGPKPPKKNKKR